jgi:hypothetical protein
MARPSKLISTAVDEPSVQAGHRQRPAIHSDALQDPATDPAQDILRVRRSMTAASMHSVRNWPNLVGRTMIATWVCTLFSRGSIKEYAGARHQYNHLRMSSAALSNRSLRRRLLRSTGPTPE